MLTSTRLTNWAGNVRFRAARVSRPRSLDELRGEVARSRRVRVLGTGHSFNPIADTTGTLVLLSDLPVEVTIDEAASTATVSGPARLGELAAILHEAGYALPNLPSLPHISVAGACATGTHGAGVGNGCLATAVERVEVVTAGGELSAIGHGDDDFPAVVVGLGCFGVVTRLTLRLEPTYDVAQSAYEDLPLPALLDGVDGILAAAYSVSVFTDWTDGADVWVKQRVGAPVDDRAFAGARPAAGQRHPVRGLSGESCTQQLGIPGPWHERLPHFRADHTPSTGAELQSEYLVARDDAAAALRAVAEIGGVLRPALQVSEIRAVAADDHWLCPAAGRASVGVHFTWWPDEHVVRPAVAAVERALAPFEARPHWGKLALFSGRDLAARYPRHADFVAATERWDPTGVFRGDLTDQWLRRGPANIDRPCG